MCQHLPMRTEVDHVVICVEDLDAAADRMAGQRGLESMAGGRHSGHGTANRIVPLGSSYLELVGVVDTGEAGDSPFGTWVMSNSSSDLQPHALCLRTDDLDTVCSRLGLQPTAMSRRRPDGVELRWRVAGLDEMVEERLPFFIEWQVPGRDHPGHADLAQASEVEAVEVVLSGDVGRLTVWTQDAVGVSVVSGPPGVDSVVIRLGDRSVVL